jgi:fructose-1,6-bisphosphatase I
VVLTLPSFEQLEKQGTINNELAVVISSIAIACKQIASLVNRAGISNLTGVAGAQNVQVPTACMPAVTKVIYS